MWYVYILECVDGRFYTGSTNNLKKRLQDHREGRGAKFTRAFGVKKLVYRQSFPGKSAALKREAEIKRWSRQKKALIINFHH